MNQLFYNIAGGTVHKIRRKKRTTISEVIVRGKREKQIKQNRRSRSKNPNLVLKPAYCKITTFQAFFSIEM